MRKSRLAIAHRIRKSGRLKPMRGWKGIHGFLDKSRREFAEYKRTGDIEVLAQSGEKVWNAFGLMIGRKIGRRIKNYGDLRGAVSELAHRTGNPKVESTFHKAYSLHIFFYGGWTEDVKEIESDLLDSQMNISELDKTLKVAS